MTRRFTHSLLPIAIYFAAFTWLFISLWRSGYGQYQQSFSCGLRLPNGDLYAHVEILVGGIRRPHIVTTHVGAVPSSPVVIGGKSVASVQTPSAWPVDVSMGAVPRSVNLLYDAATSNDLGAQWTPFEAILSQHLALGDEPHEAMSPQWNPDGQSMALLVTPGHPTHPLSVSGAGAQVGWIVPGRTVRIWRNVLIDGIRIAAIAALLATPALVIVYGARTLLGKTTPKEYHPQCPQCGYDLRGLRSDRCPECGCDWRNK